MSCRTEHLARLLEHGCEVNIQDKRDKRIPLQVKSWKCIKGLWIMISYNNDYD